MFKSRTIIQFFVVRLLIIIGIICSLPKLSYGQERIVRVDNTLESPVLYSCKDSIYTDIKTQIVLLYGEAIVEFEGIKLEADYIEMDMTEKTVKATYTLDADSNRVGIPKFTDGAEEVRAATLKYNFDTKKAYIQELKTKQEDNYLHMERAKRQSNGDIHFVEGKFTTCDLDEPHFHFQLSKAVLVPNKRIVSGPLNLWVAGVPTPLGLPFSFIPTKERQQTGIIFPQFAFSNQQLGLGFRDLGYFFPIKASDKIQTSLYASAYTGGTFGFKNRTEYKSRYKFDGTLEFDYNLFKAPFPGDTVRAPKLTIRWNHRQNQNANPYWVFSSQVNFQSDNDPTQSADPINDDYLKRTLNSSINLQRKFPNKPITMGLKMGVKQNSNSGNIDADLPTYTLNVNRFFPFKALRRNAIGEDKFYEKIGFTYNLEARNNVTFADSLLKRDEDQSTSFIDNLGTISDNFKNGITNSIRATTAIPFLDSRFTLTPSINYNLRYNQQGLEKYYDFTGDSVVTEFGSDYAGISQDLSFTASLTTSLYSYYKFVGKKQMKMRHVLTPSFNFSYTPSMSAQSTRSYVTNTQDTIVLSYSPFEQSIYRESFSRETAILSYSFNNAFEFKRRVVNDTMDDFQKFRIIEALSINGNYDFLKDSMNFSPVSVNIRLKPTKFLSVVSTTQFSLYAIDEFGQQQSTFAIRDNDKLANLNSSTVNLTLTLASKESLDKIENAKFAEGNTWNADYEYYRLHPEEIISYDIPWKINFQYNFYSNRNTDTSAYAKRRFKQNHTVNINTDASITKRWKIAVSSNYDISNKKLQRTEISLNRDMHCWLLAFRWVPTVGGQSFVVSFNAKSNLFKDAKLRFTKPPEFL